MGEEVVFDFLFCFMVKIFVKLLHPTLCDME